MELQYRKNDKTGEELYYTTHSSGLGIYIIPKKDYSKTYAIFGTRYGSVDSKFVVPGESELTEVPDGIAHYLEHKMFDQPDGSNVFDKFSRYGGNANAFTSFNITAYLFSATSNIEENIETLMDYVQSPYFTEESVQKEQGIIGQEIRMYDDSGSWKLFFNFLNCLYKEHPVKKEIAGTVESIAEITAEKLYEVYNVFYNLNNMVLCVSGNVTVDKVLKTADRLLKPSEKHTIHNVFENEPYEIVKPYVEQEFSVSMPIFNLGFKEKADCVKGDAQAAHTDILLFLLASETSELYRKLLDANLINSSFSYELFDGPGYCSVIFGGESREPQKAAEMIKDYIVKLKENGIDKEEFEIAKKSIYGDTVASLNSVDTISNILADYHFKGNNMFDYIDEIANATIEDVTKRLDCMLDVNNCTLSVVKPIQDGEK